MTSGCCGDIVLDEASSPKPGFWIPGKIVATVVVLGLLLPILIVLLFGLLLVLSSSDAAPFNYTLF